MAKNNIAHYNLLVRLNKSQLPHIKYIKYIKINKIKISNNSDKSNTLNIEFA